MRQVSKEWDDLHSRTLLPKQHLEICMNLCDETLKDIKLQTDDLLYTARDNLDYVTSLQFKSIPNYGTFEQNRWLLDGSVVIQNDFTGYISQSLSDENGVFEKPIVLRINPPDTVGAKGFTIRWCPQMNEYPTRYNIKFGTSDGTIEYTKENTESINEFIFDTDVFITYVEITINEWCMSHHRARMEHILFGIQRVYTDSKILSFTHTDENNPIDTVVPQNTIKFSIENTTNDIDLFGEKGITPYLKINQSISVRYGQEMNTGYTEWMDIGVFYLTQWDIQSEAHSVTFEGRDVFSQLTRNVTLEWTEGTEVTYVTYIRDILNSISLPHGYEINISNDKYYESSNAPLPDKSADVLLQYLVQALRCVMYADVNGKLIITDSVVDREKCSQFQLSKYEQYAYPVLNTQPYIDNVVVKEYNYVTESDKILLYDKVIDLRQGYTLPYKLRINTTETYKSYNVSAVDKLRNIALKADTYGDYIIVTLNESRRFRVVVTAYKTTGTVSQVGTINNSSVLIDNPLITNNNTSRALRRDTSYYLSNNQIASISNYRANPKISTLDMIYVECEDKQLPVVVTGVTYTFNGAYHGNIEGRIISQEKSEVDDYIDYVPPIWDDEDDITSDTPEVPNPPDIPDNPDTPDNPNPPDIPETPIQLPVSKVEWQTADIELPYSSQEMIVHAYVYPANIYETITDDNLYFASGSFPLGMSVLNTVVDKALDRIDVLIKLTRTSNIQYYKGGNIGISVGGISAVKFVWVQGSTGEFEPEVPTYYYLNGIEASDLSIVLNEGEDEQPSVTPLFTESSTKKTNYFDDTDCTYHWYSSNNKIATVSEEGVITGVSNGSCNIYCDVTHHTIERTVIFAVKVNGSPYYINYVVLKPNDITLNITYSSFGSETLHPSVVYGGSAGTKPSYRGHYEIEPYGIVTVDSRDNVTALSAGTATIKYVIEDENNNTYESEPITVTVVDKTPSPTGSDTITTTYNGTFYSPSTQIQISSNSKYYKGITRIDLHTYSGKTDGWTVISGLYEGEPKTSVTFTVTTKSDSGSTSRDTVTATYNYQFGNIILTANTGTGSARTVFYGAYDIEIHLG